MAALLAKLKVNKPPAIKKDMEINIRGKVNDKRVNDKPIDIDDEVEPVAEPKIKFIDETAKKFDRNAFLKSFQKPKVINTLLPVEPVIEKEQQTKPKTIKPKTIKPKIIKPKTIKPKQNEGEGEGEGEVHGEGEGEVHGEGEKVGVGEGETPKQKAKTKITIRRTKKPKVGVKEGPYSMITIGDATIETRLKKKTDAPVIIPASSYYMDNRKVFVNFMSLLFSKYKKDLAHEAAAPAKCPGENDINEFSLMTHQKIVRDYLNLYTPYRGLLLYHGLGSGKTCSSIAIAEGMKSNKKVIIMTPASLQVNYREELKKCGDELYRKNQFWEFVDTKDKDPETIETLSNILSISVEYIIKHGGAWLVNMSKSSNYDDLSPSDKTKLDDQIDKMIMHKYRFINYNGLRRSNITDMTNNNTINPFDNAVVIVDEAHNLVSRIVNKLTKKKQSIPISLYTLLMKAKNAKIILLSGTPIINYPNEIGILFNILRGNITSWSLKLDIREQKQINTTYLQSLFKSSILGGNILDYLEYKPSSTTLIITRNPFGFVNKTSLKDNTYAGMKLEIGERGEIDDTTFLKLVNSILKKYNIKVKSDGASKYEYKALPDTLDEFKEMFIMDNGDLKNMNMFKKRSLGLTSYFRSAQESLMPRYKKENPSDFQIIKIEMSDFQFTIYEEARSQERNQEKNNAMKKKHKQNVNDLYEDTSSTYRIFSRVFCNFVFPRPDISRPMPDKKNKKGEEINLNEAITDKVINEDMIDDVSEEEKKNRDEAFDEGDAGEGDADEGDDERQHNISYKERIQNALDALKANSDKYLTPDALQTYSPKFLHILENIQDEEHEGIHLLYTQFRALEGIGILKLILETNGFAQFKIKKIGESWSLNISEDDMAKPKFALYTGTETPEEKEIIRNVLNNAWKYVPDSITSKLKEIAPNNTRGEIIKLLMITSSGAEGISLKNVRYVHITEPYWHPVRIEQVIGRARRICSHQDLPEELRTVKVFLYLMVLSEKQLSSNDTLELRLKDKSRKDDKTPVTTDEALYEIAYIKEEISTNILKSVKESSIDCMLHSKSNKSEKLQCFSFGTTDTSKFAYELNYKNEQSDDISAKNKMEKQYEGFKTFEADGIKYAYDPKTKKVYDLDSYIDNNPQQVGELKIEGDNYKLELFDL